MTINEMRLIETVPCIDRSANNKQFVPSVTDRAIDGPEELCMVQGGYMFKDTQSRLRCPCFSEELL